MADVWIIEEDLQVSTQIERYFQRHAPSLKLRSFIDPEDIRAEPAHFIAPAIVVSGEFPDRTARDVWAIARDRGWLGTTSLVAIGEPDPPTREIHPTITWLPLPVDDDPALATHIQALIKKH